MELVKRLLWKEVIRSWPLVALVAALPTYAFGWWLPKLQDPVHGIFGYRYYDELLITVTLGILLLAVVVWSAVAGAGERFRQSYASMHFPIPSTLTPMIGFGMQLLLGAAVGFSAGYWFMHGGLLLPVTLVLFFTAAAGMSFMMTMARLSSNAVGLAVFLLYGIVKLVEGLAPSLSVDNGREMALYSLCAMLALLVAMVIQMLPGDWSRKARQASSLVVLTAVLIGFPIAKPMLDNWRQPGWQPRYDYRQLATPDGALMVHYLAAVGRQVPFPDKLTVDFSDYPRQWHREMTFDGPVLPVGFRGHDAVILARQRPGEREITLLRWDRSTTTAQPLFSFAAGRRALRDTMRTVTGQGHFVGSISPNGQYGLLSLRTPFRDRWGVDLWLLDFTRRRATLVMADTYLYHTVVGWTADQAVLTQEFNGSYRINLHSGTAAKVMIEEAQR